jgi:hypothetical protein
MWLCGTIKMRYVVAMAKTLGLRAEDFSKISYGDLRSINLNAEIPVFFKAFATEKEGIEAYCFLDKDAIESIKELLEANKGKDDKAEVWSAQSDRLSLAIRRLADKAHIEHGNKRIRFHGFRKFLFDALNRVMSIEKAKQIIGKVTSESAYLSTETLRESFALVCPLINFNSNGIKHKVSDLEEENLALKARIKELKTQIETNKNETSRMLSDLNKRLAYIEQKTKTHKPLEYRRM